MEPMNRSQLRQILVDHFDDDELKTLCFELQIEYADLPSASRKGKARELVTYLERRDRLPELVEIGKAMRPNAPWESLSKVESPVLDPDRRERIESLRHQLSEAVANLRLIEERNAQYVMDVDVPLQLVKQKRTYRQEIADLQKQLAELGAE
jgi:hypothetical protein